MYFNYKNLCPRGMKPDERSLNFTGHYASGLQLSARCYCHLQSKNRFLKSLLFKEFWPHISNP